MIDLNQFFELYGKPGMSTTERANADKELADYYTDRIDEARSDGEDSGYDSGNDVGYDEGYDEGKSDAEEDAA